MCVGDDIALACYHKTAAVAFYFFSSVIFDIGIYADYAVENLIHYIGSGIENVGYYGQSPVKLGQLPGDVFPCFLFLIFIPLLLGIGTVYAKVKIKAAVKDIIQGVFNILAYAGSVFLYGAHRLPYTRKGKGGYSAAYCYAQQQAEHARKHISAHAVAPGLVPLRAVGAGRIALPLMVFGMLFRSRSLPVFSLFAGIAGVVFFHCFPPEKHHVLCFEEALRGSPARFSVKLKQVPLPVSDSTVMS